MSLVGYARVSTAEGRQLLDRQLDALNSAGCERVFEDHASGAAPERPNLAACLDYLRRGDVLVVLDLDRWGAAPANSSPSSTSSTSAASDSARSTHRWTPPRQHRQGQEPERERTPCHERARIVDGDRAHAPFPARPLPLLSPPRPGGGPFSSRTWPPSISSTRSHSAKAVGRCARRFEAAFPEWGKAPAKIDLLMSDL